MGAHLRGIERVEVEVQLLGGVQGLDLELPLRVVALRDLVEQVVRRMTAGQHKDSSQGIHVDHRVSSSPPAQ